ncbi:hypothetical protein [Synechococcus sp. Cu2B8-bc1011]|uniref:hypothetical protein n=1 Tax=Synechococcus sp. Cu2B8-bc1011 TaxID=3093725 RepID=UPI0039AF5A1A
MNSPRTITIKKSGPKIPAKEQGLSLLLALMMGMVLIAGVSGLLLRQLMGRKLGAAESYQQMAETAALNGFNRILSELNEDNHSTYKGYLFTLNHNGGDPENPGSEQWGWNAANQTNFPLRELCTDRSHLPAAVPPDTGTSNTPHTDLTAGTSSQRNDGLNNIKLQYRLRGYATTATATNNGIGEGRFQIEGIVLRDGDDPKTSYLARTLLLRSLYVNSIVAGEGDWAVLSGPTLFLGDTKILKSSGAVGEGKILLNVSSAEPYQTATGCFPTNLLGDVQASASNNNLENRIIPILEKGLPTSNIWDLGRSEDKQSGSDNVRIWTFDDTQSLVECQSIACSRDTNTATAQSRSDLEENNAAVIRLSANELCNGTGSDCHVFVEHINLNKTRLLIETSANRPVVLHLEYPGTSTVAPSEPGITGSINLGNGSQLCGVNSGETTCNAEPEQLVILSGAPKPPGVRTCSVTPQTDQYVLAFDGDSLPNAIIHLIPGFVSTGSSTTKLNGLIWADGICTNSGPFSLITDTSGGSSVVRDLNELWDWENKNFPGYGQLVTRGIRGTGLDTFRRW